MIGFRQLQIAGALHAAKAAENGLHNILGIDLLAGWAVQPMVGQGNQAVLVFLEKARGVGFVTAAQSFKEFGVGAIHGQEGLVQIGKFTFVGDYYAMPSLYIQGYAIMPSPAQRFYFFSPSNKMARKRCAVESQERPS